MAQGRQQAVRFREIQHFRQWWIWLIIIGVSGLMWWGFVEQIILGRSFGDNPGPDWMVILFAVLFGIGLPWLMAASKLTTQVGPDALYVQFYPFILKPQRIDWDTIAVCTPGRYNPVLDYGGWGIKYGRDGKVMNVSGNLGVRLEFHDGKPLMIGTRHPLELAAAIEANMGKGRG